MKVSARVRVSGPLSSFMAGFAAELTVQGYTDLSLANQLRVATHFSRWLEAHRIELHQLTPELVGRYVALRRRTRTAFSSRRALAPLLEHVGLLKAAVVVDRKGGELLERYRTYLVDERGLSPSVVTRYEATAREFLDDRAPATLTRADVLSFVRRRGHGPGLVVELSSLRSFLRFLHVSGEAASALVSTVPSVAGWRQASLPKALEPAQVRAVVASCDRRTTIGRRDYAALLLMLRLGLRAGEVAALTLDDVDWTNGELVVHGKGGTISRLPLPIDVGAALVAYLRRRRRQTPTRMIFLRSRAPYSAATSSTIVSLAGRALRRAGVPTGGGHRLRHTAATQMLRRGASLTEIAQVLRHRHIDTTAIYAKVDRDGLRSVAQPWPTGDAVDRDRLRPLAQAWPGGAA
jgi:integrase/recombinase XerD